ALVIQRGSLLRPITRRGVLGESIADPWLAEEIPRARAVALDFPAERCHEHAQVFGLVYRVRTPNRLQNRAMGQDTPRPLCKEQQEVELLRRQPDLLATSHHAPAIAVDDQVAA